MWLLSGSSIFSTSRADPVVGTVALDALVLDDSLIALRVGVVDVEALAARVVGREGHREQALLAAGLHQRADVQERRARAACRRARSRGCGRPARRRRRAAGRRAARSRRPGCRSCRSRTRLHPRRWRRAPPGTRVGRRGCPRLGAAPVTGPSARRPIRRPRAGEAGKQRDDRAESVGEWIAPLPADGLRHNDPVMAEITTLARCCGRSARRQRPHRRDPLDAGGRRWWAGYDRARVEREFPERRRTDLAGDRA